MINLFRKIPHPCYGNYCGGSRHNEGKEPIDNMDSACKVHDDKLEAINDALLKLKELEKDLKKQRKEADADLDYRVRRCKPKTLYGKIYRKMILKVF